MASLREIVDFFLSAPGLFVWLIILYIYNVLAHERSWLAQENFHFGIPVTAASCAVLWYEVQVRWTAAGEPSIFLWEQLFRIFSLAVAIVCVALFCFSVWGQILFKRRHENDLEKGPIWLLVWANIWATSTYILLYAKLHGSLWNA